MKRKIYSPAIVSVYRKNFLNNHSKFIHAYPTKLEDLGKTAKLDDNVLTLVGQDDDNKGVFLNEQSGDYYIGELKEFVANRIEELELVEA
jgi:hypothetical protein